MKKHAVILRLGSNDQTEIKVTPGFTSTEVYFLNNELPAKKKVNHQLIFDELKKHNFQPSNIGWDILLLAVAVFSADTCISRSTDSQDGWSREIELNVPVNDPELWTTQTELLLKLLRFLTGDRWLIRFRQRPSDFSEIVVPIKDRNKPIETHTVCLFSGGLDSFIGALNLISSGNQPLLIGHHKSKDVSIPQKQCANYLIDQFPEKPPIYVPLYLRTPKEIFNGGDEKTERGRSFLFLALAVLCASSLGKETELIVPENGLISLNIPLTPLRIGASSTRTTHPFYLDGYQQLLTNLDFPIKIKNPYQFDTKGEMAKRCKQPEVLRGFAFDTSSCASSSKRRWVGGGDLEQCGHCVPCIIRRAALEYAFGEDLTPYTLNIKSRPLDIEKSEGNQVQAYRMAISRLKKDPSLANYLIYKTGPLSNDQAFLKNAADVYFRGMMEIENLIKDVTLFK